MADSIKRQMLKAQQCVDDKEYDNSIKLFNDILRRIKPTHESHIVALDTRASARIRLRRFTEAYEDGKSMIREHKQDARGYLRTIQALQYQAREKNDEKHIQSALRVARAGVAHADKETNIVLYKQLSRAVEELTTRVNVKRIDPTSQLPDELLVNIFENFAAADLRAIRPVSKRWNDLISGTPRFWRKLSISPKGLLKPRGIQTILRMATDTANVCHVTELEVDGPAPKDAHNRRAEAQNHNAGVATLVNVLKQTRKLQALRLKRVWPTCKRPLGTLPWNKLQLPELRSLEVSFDEHPKIIENWSTFGWIADTLSSFPKLEHFSVCAEDMDTEDMDEATLEAIQWPSSLPNLKSLHLTTHSKPSFSNIWSPFTLNLEQLALSASNLERLKLSPSLEVFYTEEDDHPIPDLSLFSQLKSLGVFWHSDQYVVPLLPQSLEHLSLTCINSAKAEFSQSPPLDVSMCPRLKALETNCPTVRGGWDQLLQSSHCQLEELKVKDSKSNPDIGTFLSFLVEAGALGPRLKKITLEGMRFKEITDELASFIAKHMPNLREITLSGITDLTGVGVHALATNLRDLTYLHMGISPNANVDVIPFCRKRGIEVRGIIGIQLDDLGKGKKVRY